MEMIAPSGPVYQAGTLSGNPLAMTAGIETLRILCQPGTYENLEHNAIALESGLSKSAAMFNIPIYTSRVGSILTTFFNNSEVTDYASARSSDTSKYALFFRNMLESGIYLAPSQFEAAFITLSHTRDDIETTLAAAERAFSKKNVNQY
jgi:glutamate-1-semialdehyde 2,1-aminomutase